MRYLKIAVLLCLLAVVSAAQTSKPKPSATPSGEKAQFDKAVAIVPPDQRAEALAKFVAAYPKSTRITEAREMLAAARVDAGNAKLNSGEYERALAIFKSAAADAPKPISDKLWKDSLGPLPGKLYFGGAREVAYEIAVSLEEKAESSTKQLVGLASFYIGVEDGSKGRQIAEKVIALEPNSTLGYQALGYAHRVNFQLEDAAAAFAKALELEPDSTSARRSLAELKRALGRSDESVMLYREALAKDENDVVAETGLVLALFDAGKRGDAEAAFAKAIEKNDANVMLLGNVAYLYAVQGDADKAIEFATKALEKDPRFVWSHIALARGHLIKGQPAEAEKALMAARQYGNFSALSYELAAAKAAGGFYREAAEEMARYFSIKDGIVTTRLGGRVARESKHLLELVGMERRASIFAPTAADDPDAAARLVALLELKLALDAAEPNADAVSRAVDAFTAGSDRMRIHRQLYAAAALLDKKAALPKVIELTRAASAGVDAAAEIPAAGAAVMANELYAVRAEAAARGQYIEVPPVPKNVVASILRGRIEDIAGWTQFQMEQSSDAVVRLRRAVQILPVDSTWWRASMWHLGAALAATGKDQEALDSYVKAYKSGGPDPLKYLTIRGLYTRINGKADGLDALVGEDPSPQTVASTTEPTPTPAPTNLPMPEPSPSPTPTPEPSPTPEPKQTPADDLIVPPQEPMISQKPKPVEDSTGTSCTLTSSEESITLNSGGGDIALMIGVDRGGLDDLKATPSSISDISISLEIVPGVNSRAVFVVKSASGKAGLYTITFELPCGKKEIPVRVN